MERAHVATLVVEALAEQIGKPSTELSLDLTFEDDLGLDSLDAVELLVALEDETGLVVELDRLDALRTVDDLVDWLMTAMPAAA